MNAYKYVKSLLRPLKMAYLNYKMNKYVSKFKRQIRQDTNPKRIFYLGVTENNNLGDNAQYLCIKKWIKKNYPNHSLYQINATIITEKKESWLPFFKDIFDIDNDIIVFQSGYNTQDCSYRLGFFKGSHELMHRIIADNLPKAKILMMPQTIYFEEERYRKATSESYDKCSRMLFLARDEQSYKEALDMFPHLKIKLFPDIVTTLIGQFNFSNQRKGTYLCKRNDDEKFYSDLELEKLATQLSQYGPITVGDTQSSANGETTRKNLQQFIYQEIEKFSRFQVVITDRYHGTIFSLCANTPVIIIKTNDHKVYTGANWFKGIYDNHVYLAENLDQAKEIAIKILKNFEYKQLTPYFEEHYYKNLASIFNEMD